MPITPLVAIMDIKNKPYQLGASLIPTESIGHKLIRPYSHEPSSLVVPNLFLQSRRSIIVQSILRTARSSPLELLSYPLVEYIALRIVKNFHARCRNLTKYIKSVQSAISSYLLGQETEWRYLHSRLNSFFDRFLVFITVCYNLTKNICAIYYVITFPAGSWPLRESCKILFTVIYLSLRKTVQPKIIMPHKKLSTLK